MPSRPPDKSNTGGSSLGGFSEVHLAEYMKGAVAVANIRATSKPRTVIAKYKQAVSGLISDGAFTYLGNTRREINATDITSKLKIICDAINARTIPVEDYALFASFVSFHAPSRRTALRKHGHVGRSRYVPWSYIVKINAIAKRCAEDPQ